LVPVDALRSLDLMTFSFSLIDRFSMGVVALAATAGDGKSVFLVADIRLEADAVCLADIVVGVAFPVDAADVASTIDADVAFTKDAADVASTIDADVAFTNDAADVASTIDAAV
jgi:hypothetical protein